MVGDYTGIVCRFEATGHQLKTLNTTERKTRMGFEKTVQNQKRKGRPAPKQKESAKPPEKKPPSPPKPPPREIAENNLDKKSKERLIGLREELEATCRHRQEVLEEKKGEMDRFNEELKAIDKREAGILRDISAIKRPIPLFDNKICAWAGCKEIITLGEKYCAKHRAESEKLSKPIKTKRSVKPKK